MGTFLLVQRRRGRLGTKRWSTSRLQKGLAWLCRRRCSPAPMRWSN